MVSLTLLRHPLGTMMESPGPSQEKSTVSKAPLWASESPLPPSWSASTSARQTLSVLSPDIRRKAKQVSRLERDPGVTDINHSWGRGCLAAVSGHPMGIGIPWIRGEESMCQQWGKGGTMRKPDLSETAQTREVEEGVVGRDEKQTGLGQLECTFDLQSNS